MITQPEYLVSTSQLEDLAEVHSQNLSVAVKEATTSTELTTYAKPTVSQYSEEAEYLIRNSLYEAGIEASKHYEHATGELLTTQERDALVNRLIDEQHKEIYYGSTLTKRFKFLKRLLEYSIARSAIIGPDVEVQRSNVERALTNTVWRHKKLMLGEVVRLEQKVMQAIGAGTDYTLVRWSLSGQHAIEDVCDDLASNVTKRVAKYIKDVDLDVDPKGVYFISDLPLPPHPNCMCNFTIVGTEDQTKQGLLGRTTERLKNLWRKLRGY